MMQSFDGPLLHIYLDKLIGNYRLLSETFAGPECAAVVKANAYGLGVEEVATALASAGCQSFFVATLEEGIALRQLLPDRRIAVFHGVGPGEELAFVNHRLIPVLNSPKQIERWRAMAKEQADTPSILHVDTAMGRLGLTKTEWQKLAHDEEALSECQICLLMTHLACSPEPDHPTNALQLELFNEARAAFPSLPTSMANSSGIFLDAAYHGDLARPGCSLYGITPNADKPNPVANVVQFSAPILQVRTLDCDQKVGYGSTVEYKKGTKLAAIAIGYADGVQRALTGKLFGFLGDIKVPLAGRVTMDMLTFDVSNVAEGQLNEADRIVLIDERQTVDDIAQMSDTIGYEVFTRLGRRVKRTHSGADL